MRKVKLGRSGIEVAPWAFGGNVFGWTADEAASFRLLDAFVDHGFELVDTADVYLGHMPGCSVGQSETIIGRWFAQGGGRREKVVLATKVGIKMAEGEEGLSAAYIRRAVDASLKRLQTDRIDLYQAHRDDLNVPQEETLEAFAELVKAGKVRAIGASNFSPERLGEALRISAERGLPRYETLQPWYNLYDRDKFEGALQDLCVREEVGVIPYFALASGFLTGKYRSEKDLEGRARAYRAKDMLNARGFKILAAMDKVAAETGFSLAEIALAWLRVQPSIAAPIASATSVEQLEDLAKAVEIELSPEQVRQLSEASAF